MKTLIQQSANFIEEPKPASTASLDPGPPSTYDLRQPASVQSGAPTPPPFFGFETYTPPQHEWTREQPHHRHICQLLAQGFTSTEIAQQTGWTTTLITQIKKQPWAQKYIAQTMEACGRESLISTLQGVALESVQTLAETMRGKFNARASDRIKAAQILLEKTCPSAQVVMHGKVDPNALSDAELMELAQAQTSTSTTK